MTQAEKDARKAIHAHVQKGIAGLDAINRKEETMANLQQAAKDAIAVQDACNLSGIAHSFLDAVRAVNEEASRLNEGTDWRNNHPIIRLFVDKMASLCGMQGEETYSHYADALNACKGMQDWNK